MAVGENADSGSLLPQIRNGAPILLRVNEVNGYLEQVGRNTRYIIHAEEVLAENFAFMVTGQSVAEPERLHALRRLLAEHQEAAKPAAP